MCLSKWVKVGKKLFLSGETSRSGQGTGVHPRLTDLSISTGAPLSTAVFFRRTSPLEWMVGLSERPYALPPV